MAKNDLKLNIKSTFDSDGMKKLDSALKDTSRAVGSTAKVIGSVSDELKGMSGEAGKAAGAISGLFSAFTQGGPVALIIAGITTAVGLLVQAFKGAKEAAKTAGEAMVTGFSKSIDKISEGVKTLKTNLTETLAAIKKNKDEADKSVELENRGQAVAIKTKYQNKRAGTDDKFEKTRLKADEEYELQEQKLTEAMKKQENAVEAATNAVAEHQKTLDGLKEKTAEAEKKVEDETRYLEQSGLTGVKSQREKLQNAVEAARKAVIENGGGAMSGQYKTHTSTVAGTVVYTKEEQTWNQVLTDAANALRDFEEDNAESIKRMEDYDKAMEKAKEAQKAQVEQTKKLEDAQKELAVVQQETSMRHQEFNVELAAAKEKYDEIIKNVNEQEQAKKKAEEEKSAAEAAAVEALYASLNREADLNDLKDDLKEQQKKYKEVVEDSAKKLKELNQKDKDLNKALTDLKDQADGTRRSLADMARAAQEGWAGNPNQNLGDFKAGRRGDINNQKKNENQRGKNIGQAQRELARRGANLFDRRGNIKRSASVDDIAKFAETADYLGFEGVSNKTVDKLRGARDKLKNKLFNKDGSLKNLNDKNSHEMNQYRRIDKALQGKDAADEAERIAKEKKENEKKREKLEEERTEALKKISGNIDKIKEKMGM